MNNFNSKNVGWVSDSVTQQNRSQTTDQEASVLGYTALSQSTSGLLPSDWCEIPTADTFRQISTNNKKVKTKDCKAFGKYPVIDQGQEEVAGFIDDEDRVIEVLNPLVIFGDHTRIIKWVNHNFVPGADGTKILEAAAFLNTRYFYYQLRSIELPDKGYSRHFKYLNESIFRIAPLAEQHQIAAKLDELLAQVDSIKTRLDAIPNILKRFRQSVLSAAVSGKLTEDFRGNNQLHKEKIENISVLVTKGASPKWQGINYIDDPNQTLFVTSENVGGMKILLDNPKYVEDEFNEKQQRSLLMKGDVLTNIVGASIGRAVVWDKNVKANINQAVCIIRLDKNKCIPDYLCYFLNSPIGIDALIDNKVDVARANVSLGSVKSLELFLPDLSEQTEIVRRVEQLFIYADQIEQRVKDAQARVNHLTQSILAKAFRGELTADWRAQNPDLISGENSAEALLAKIQAQRLKEKPKTGRKARA